MKKFLLFCCQQYLRNLKWRKEAKGLKWNLSLLLLDFGIFDKIFRLLSMCQNAIHLSPGELHVLTVLLWFYFAISKQNVPLDKIETPEKRVEPIFLFEKVWQKLGMLHKSWRGNCSKVWAFYLLSALFKVVWISGFIPAKIPEAVKQSISGFSTSVPWKLRTRGVNFQVLFSHLRRGKAAKVFQYWKYLSPFFGFLYFWRPK